MTAAKSSKTVRNRGCAETAAAVRDGSLTAVECANAALEEIVERDGELGAFLEVFSDDVLEDARQIDLESHENRAALPLAGVPIALKDNICVAGHRTTAGSKILEPWTAPYSATVVDRLRAAGAIVVGKTNLDEFAMGSSTENSALGRTVNPHDLERVPGGSSGGSAAAVAANLVPGALGSDTGGSIRQPAAFCGLVGFKPTYGRVSRYGLIAFASSLDQIGPLTRNVDDAALLLEVISGFDRRDPTTVDGRHESWFPTNPANPQSLTLGVPANWFADGLAPAVQGALEELLGRLEAIGITLRPVDLPHERYSIATYYVVATAEASSNLARYDGVRYGLRVRHNDDPGDTEDPTLDHSDIDAMFAATRTAGFGPEVKRRILLGTYVLSAGFNDAHYGRAQRVRTLIRRDFAAAFELVDAIIGPTTPSTAFKLGEKRDDPLSMYLSDVFTVTANLAGLPAISVPCGSDEAGLPIGAQILAPPFAERTVLEVAKLIEESSDSGA